jgi:hypothetical protein
MCGHFPAFLSRFDYWGTLLDLFGLAVLMSQDIEALKFLDKFARRFPGMSRLQEIAERFRNAIKRFENAFPAIQQEMRLDTFEGPDAEIVVGLLSNAKEAIPEKIDLCACYVGQSLQTMEIVVWAAHEGALKLLAGPMTEIAFIEKLDKKMHNFTYTAGFTMMALGSLLFLLSIVFQ